MTSPQSEQGEEEGLDLTASNMAILAVLSSWCPPSHPTLYVMRNWGGGFATLAKALATLLVSIIRGPTDSRRDDSLLGSDDMKASVPQAMRASKSAALRIIVAVVGLSNARYLATTTISSSLSALFLSASGVWGLGFKITTYFIKRYPAGTCRLQGSCRKFPRDFRLSLLL